MSICDGMTPLTHSTFTPAREPGYAYERVDDERR